MDEDLSSTDQSERPESPATDNPKRQASAKREMPVSTLVRLMGVPTSQDLTILESKLDIILTKISSLSARMDRMEKYRTESQSESYLERIDYQLAEVRSILKKVLPKVMARPETDIEVVDELGSDEPKEQRTAEESSSDAVEEEANAQ